MILKSTKLGLFQRSLIIVFAMIFAAPSIFAQNLYNKKNYVQGMIGHMSIFEETSFPNKIIKSAKEADDIHNMFGEGEMYLPDACVFKFVDSHDYEKWIPNEESNGGWGDEGDGDFDDFDDFDVDDDESIDIDDDMAELDGFEYDEEGWVDSSEEPSMDTGDFEGDEGGPFEGLDFSDVGGGDDDSGPFADVDMTAPTDMETEELTIEDYEDVQEDLEYAINGEGEIEWVQAESDIDIAEEQDFETPGFNLDEETTKIGEDGKDQYGDIKGDYTYGDFEEGYGALEDGIENAAIQKQESMENFDEASQDVGDLKKEIDELKGDIAILKQQTGLGAIIDAETEDEEEFIENAGKDLERLEADLETAEKELGEAESDVFESKAKYKYYASQEKAYGAYKLEFEAEERAFREDIKTNYPLRSKRLNTIKSGTIENGTVLGSDESIYCDYYEGDGDGEGDGSMCIGQLWEYWEPTQDDLQEVLNKITGDLGDCIVELDGKLYSVGGVNLTSLYYFYDDERKEYVEFYDPEDVVVEVSRPLTMQLPFDSDGNYIGRILLNWGFGKLLKKHFKDFYSEYKDMIKDSKGNWKYYSCYHVEDADEKEFCNAFGARVASQIDYRFMFYSSTDVKDNDKNHSTTAPQVFIDKKSSRKLILKKKDATDKELDFSKKYYATANYYNNKGYSFKDKNGENREYNPDYDSMIKIIDNIPGTVEFGDSTLEVIKTEKYVTKKPALLKSCNGRIR
ncbi:hypothetical protein KKA47_06110, partial [bacterium]|nr:hypothetical protein [bacterium]